MGILLILVLVLLVLGSAPWYPYSSGWGYYPSGLLVVFLIILLLLGLGRIR